jgi:predicted TIM-barrel fold metal-dependent hydrolase
MPEVRVALANTYYDSAATPFLYDFEIFRAAADLVGANRILFATDYPLLRQGPFLDRIRALGLAEPWLRQVLGENAAQLLGDEGWPTVGPC